MKNEEIFKATLKASRDVALFEVELINEVLNALADKAVAETSFILEENKKDLERMEKSNPKYDRLLLNEKRIEGIAQEIRNVAKLSYPVGKVLDKKTLPNGLELTKVTVPMGVIGIIYEARPNVTFDCFSLCLKSGNATILKGGSDAEYSNKAIISVIHSILKQFSINKNIVQLLPPDREATAELLNAVGYVDLLIPRGSQNLINFVRQNAKIPVIETGAGIVHVYFDKFGDVEKGKNIINNSKTRRVSVCNALDCLLVHQDRLGDLGELIKPLKEKNVIIFADESSRNNIKDHYPADLLKPATADSFGTEFLDYKMAIKTVQSFEEAIDHISNYSSKHSEAIVSENNQSIEKFMKMVDAAAVYANASTAFTDGAQFGLGAEIGISTQKLHARGPMALSELTSYKWIIKGNGQIRS